MIYNKILIIIQRTQKSIFTIAVLCLLGTTFYCNAQENKNVIKEVYQTDWNIDDNIDSPAFWQSSDKKQNLLIATSKNKHSLFIYDAENGKFIREFGKKGNKEGDFKRPNGIWVIDNLLLICERDNHRIQIFSLPDFIFLGFIGENELKKPYGLTVYKSNTEYIMYVTDQYEEADGTYPQFDKLNERVKKYSFTVNDNKIKSKHIKSFGDTKGKGRLMIVESIYADPINNNLVIAEEDKNQNVSKIYDLDGNFKQIIIGDDIYKYQAEGIALLDCGNGEGYWFCTDQDFYLTNHNSIHIFDRKTLKFVGSFITGKTDNTDGIWITQQDFGKFKRGALFAVNNDGGVSAFDIEEIIKIMKLKCNF